MAETAVFFIAFFLVCLAFSASATTYYIDKANTACSDIGNDSGTEAKPWCTIDKASRTMVAGDTVFIKAGTYSEPIIARNSGSAGNYISYKSYGTDKVTINPQGDPPPGTVINGIPHDTRQRRGLYLLNVSYNWIEGFHFVKPGRWLWAQQARYNVIKDNNFFDTEAGGGDTSGLYFFESEYNKVIGNHLERPGRNFGPNTGGDSIVIKKSSKNIVESNTFGNAGHSNFSVRCSSNNIIRNNFFYNVWEKIGEVYNCSDLDLSIPCERNLIEKNTFTETYAAGYHGIQYSGQKGIIRNNVFQNSRGAGISLYLCWDGGCNPEAHDARGNRIYSNTFYRNNGVGVGLRAADYHASQMAGNVIKNNILFQNGLTESNAQISVRTIDSEVEDLSDARYFSVEPTYFINNNIFNSTAGENSIKGSGGQIRNLSWWVSSFPANFSGNIEANPEFMNATANDFHLASGSPMIDAGAFLTTTTNAGTNSTTLQVQDAGYFFDGFGIPGEAPDVIQLQGQIQTAGIASINYSTNTITLMSPLSWSAGQGVALAFSGNAPDIGAFESSGSAPPNCTMAQLMAYISQWKAGTINMVALMDKISKWKAGLPC